MANLIHKYRVHRQHTTDALRTHPRAYAFLLPQFTRMLNLLFARFDHDYWAYLVELEQPPAALYRQHFDCHKPRAKFKA